LQDVHNNSEADRFIQALFSHIFKDIKITVWRTSLVSSVFISIFYNNIYEMVVCAVFGKINDLSFFLSFFLSYSIENEKM
jgi:hypothetical protein